MVTLAICPCGEKFLITDTFPRKLACHRCGSQTIAYNAREIDTADGWRLSEEQSTQPSRCFDCDAPCFTGCSRCGRFYCPHHGRILGRLGSRCVDCYDRLRPGFLFKGVLFIVCGIISALGGVIALEANEPEFPWYAAILSAAPGCIGMGIGRLWFWWRAYP